MKRNSAFFDFTIDEKMCAKISTGNTPNTNNQFIWPICPNRPIIWDIFEKSPHHMSIFQFFNDVWIIFQKLLKTSANPKSAKKKKKAAEKAVDAAPPTLIESEAAPALVEEE